MRSWFLRFIKLWIISYLGLRSSYSLRISGSLSNSASNSSKLVVLFLFMKVSSQISSCSILVQNYLHDITYKLYFQIRNHSGRDIETAIPAFFPVPTFYLLRE